MGVAVLMEYAGFRTTAKGREYAFHVRFSERDSRDYTVTIADGAFTSRLVSYQDGPSVCSSKLKRELSVNPDALTGTSFSIDEKEIEDHNARHEPEHLKHRGRPKLPNG